MSTKEEILGYILKTPENTNPNILKGMLNDIEGGGSSNILVVGATTDQEHATETEWPLILDKTMDEMLAAEYTILAIHPYSPSAEYVYWLVENARVSAEVEGVTRGSIGWDGSIGGETNLIAEAQNFEGSLEAVCFVSESDGDEPFVLYGTMNAEGTGGTITGSADSLAAAIQNDKRVILKIEYDMSGTIVNFNVDLSGNFNISSSNTYSGSVMIEGDLAIATVVEINGGGLAFTWNTYTLTPSSN